MTNDQPGEEQLGGTNRLAHETSPYLLQHAHNPVDWYPWGTEAFEAARHGDDGLERPIFLSIGYSTCHWCHVMERESFESEEVARLLNDNFISIKVDREERPDVDAVYMTACHLLTGGGGWPLTIIMTPRKHPFFAATYIPRQTVGGRIGLLELLPRVVEVWRNRKEEVERSSSRLVHALQAHQPVAAGQIDTKTSLERARENLLERYDERHGGFGPAPKFPAPHNLSFLLREGQRNSPAREAAVHTLRAMRLGGLYDHLGFGFHRYSTDARWLVPHFEKMLYDQAMLMAAYTDGYQATGQAWMAETVKEIFTYVQRDLTATEGAFFAAEDADSEGEEGRFYLWSHRELNSLLSPQDAELFGWLFNIRDAGNYLDEATGAPTGRNIPHLTAPLEEAAPALGLTPAELELRLQNIRQTLFDARACRVRPSRDDKILADWNGLMIAALARAGDKLRLPDALQAAKKAADFLVSELRTTEGQLWHCHGRAASAIPGFLEDYAYVAWGLLELYLATYEAAYLTHSRELVDHLLSHHWDERAGGFFQSGKEHEPLPSRHKEGYDGAIPSGNSVAALTLLRLATLTGDENYFRRGQATVEAFGAELARAPQGFSHLLQGGQWLAHPHGTILVVGPAAGRATRSLLDSIRRQFLPQHLVLFRPDGAQVPEAGPASPLNLPLPSQEQAQAYLCQDQTCAPPTADLQELMQRIETML